MKKIIPFKKQIKFDNNLYEVTSISLEHTLHKEGSNIIGSFIISGEYIITESSTNTLEFNYELPFTIDVADKYNIDNAIIDINDFYYEIVDNKYLEVNIEVKLDRIEEIIIPENVILNNIEDDRNDDKKTLDDDKKRELEEVSCIEEEDDIIPDNNIRNVSTEEVKSLFSNMDNVDSYVTYKVCILREGDTIDSFMSAYSVTKEELELYNDLSSINVGDKIIIPYVKNK